MSSPSQPIPLDPKYILDLMVKRRWILAIPFFFAMIVGIVLAVKLPKIYTASTLILIHPQRVPQDYVKPIVSTDPSERISTLSQQVLSRTNLEKIIQEFNLFSDKKTRSMYMEEKVSNLRKRISVKVSSTGRRQGSDAFSISFEDKDPEAAMKVTNALTAYFIDENLKLRESLAIGTSEFLAAELQTMKIRLEKVEAEHKQYRETYMGELPEELPSNLQILDRMQNRLSDARQQLSAEKIRLSVLENQSATAGQNIMDIDQMKEHLQYLLSRYTDRHPDVVRLKARIEEMEKQKENHPGAEKMSSAQQPTFIPFQYRTQYNQILQEIKRIEADIADTEKQVELYQKRVENTPKREQELISLNRDYENIQSAYNTLQEKKIAADIAVKLEQNQKGEQFRVLDPAKVPQMPSKPDMRKLFVMVVGAGLAIGGGIVFLLEFLKTTFNRLEDIEKELSVPVLCAVPQIIDEQVHRKKRIERVAFAAFGCLSLAFFGVFALFTQKGVGQTLAVIRKVIPV
ncbi:protein GumC [Desulfosarcina sp. OttesenSCG-928-G10]|nr:protein GumC [Desulfosarcina sp. OttesenSCG-928-G10]